MTVSRALAAPDYFRTLGIPLLEGREFTSQDDANAAPVMIVNEAFCRRYFPGQSPIGRKIRAWDKSFIVVGLVKTHKYYNLREPPRPFFYAPFAQTDTPAEIAIGIRMALGAQSTDVLGMVIRKGMVLTAAGILLGALAALAATRLMAGMLVNMSPADPLVFAGATLFLGLVALPASYIPAKLAAKVDPMIALRCQ